LRVHTETRTAGSLDRAGLAGEVIAMCGADVMVMRGHEKEGERFFTNPKLIVEVLSRSTASVDRHEGWEPTVLVSLESVLELRSIDLRLPLARIYDGEEL
jgi:hypothetical protein